MAQAEQNKKMMKGGGPPDQPAAHADVTNVLGVLLQLRHDNLDGELVAVVAKHGNGARCVQADELDHAVLQQKDKR